MSFGFGVGDFIAVFDKAKKYRDRFKDAPKHLKSLDREITSLYAVLEGIDLIKEELKDYEYESLKAPANECSKLLDEIETVFKANGHSDQHPNPSWRKRITLNPEEVQQLRLRIALNVQFLNVINQFKDSQVILDTNRHVKSMHDEQKSQQERQILEWLDRNNYEPQYQGHLSQRQGNSGKWFLESSGFHDWISEKGQGLLCHGIPGSGKTVMCSIVIDHLSCQFPSDESTAIAYIFCNAQNQEEGTFHRYVSNLTKQLAKQMAQSRFPDSLKALYEKHQNNHSSPQKGEIEKLLFELAAACTRRLFIIIDALDECSADVQLDLIALVSELQQKSSANILLTTRPIPEISCNAKLAQCRPLEIRAPEDDIREFVQSRMKLMHKRVQGNPALKEEIKDVILRRADGICDADLGTKVISWVVCAKRPLRVAELQHALAVEDEPQIDEQSLYSQEEILSVCLGLVRIDAESILRLVHQTAVEYFEDEKDKDGFFPGANVEMATVCVRYLAFDRTQQWAAQCNYKINEEPQDPEYPFCHYAALHWGDHARDAQQLPQSIQQFFDDRAALEMSWKIWNRRSLVKVPCKRAHIAAWFGIASVFKSNLLRDEEIIACEGEPPRMPLNFAVRGGHLQLVELLLEFKPILSHLRMPDDSQAELCSSQSPTLHSRFRSAIVDAVEFGPGAMVDVLIKFCARERIQAELPNSETGGLLHRAIRKDSSIYKALFGQHNTSEGFTKATISEIGLQLEAKLYQETPLMAAVVYENPTAVDLLLGVGASIEACGTSGDSALRQAVMRGNFEVFIKLLDHGANMDVEAKEKPLISLAAQFSHNVDIIRYLIDSLHQNPNERHENKLPIEYALSSLERYYGDQRRDEERIKGQEEVVKVLLQRLDIDDPQHIYRTVLTMAAEHGRSDLVKVLLETLDIEDPQDLYRTVLRLAAKHGSSDLVDFMASKKDFDKDSRDDWMCTLLKEAQCDSNFRMCKALLDGGAVLGQEIEKEIETFPSGLKRVQIVGRWYYWKRR
ncbi:ankyrin repeat protein [Diaporthe amygdali]|uniref:ankyrin repeat protein n=1 Tax=Phomopsis amygdali TaxID=1214568 RepID=UPI0022FEE2FD|nr:ankyrin repeat protein [Diaporthe amygdali]KAJ0109363.1 ankyrin repeat protein [Diaporthe amygdali]